jgi:choline dehydrogenase-like flavoprotein
MTEDAQHIPPGTQLECDILIIGSGAGGIACACELIGSGKQVILLESGGAKVEADTQALAKGEVADPSSHGPLEQYRKRVFGGTTTVWGGRCAPFDGIDFEKRPHVPNSGWPIGLADLEPYYRRAHAYTHTGDYDYHCASALATGDSPTIPGLRDDIWQQDKLWRFSLPTNFAAEFGQQIKGAPNVRVLLHATALKLLTTADGRQITGAEATSIQDNRFTVKASSVVVAAGGLESTRLLMLSNDVNPEGLGNQHDQLGRYYLSHISGDLGEIHFEPKNRPIVWQYQRAKDGVYVKRNLRIREDVQRRDGLLNFRCVLTHPPFADASHGSGVLSAVYLVKRFFRGQIPPEYSKELAEAGYHHVPQHLRNVILGAPGLIRFGTHWFLRRTLAHRKYPSVSLKSRSNSYTIHFDAEQTPNPDSRVMLGDKVDRFGQRQLRADWRHSGLDIESVVRSHALLRNEIEGSGVGFLNLDNEVVPDVVKRGCGVGSHHIGTTRMSSDPRYGVVDENCQVHDVKGLFLASPSVFPTASYANPVLTITAIALRIADHLRTNRH